MRGGCLLDPARHAVRHPMAVEVETVSGPTGHYRGGRALPEFDVGGMAAKRRADRDVS